MTERARAWAHGILRRSPLKRAKWEALRAAAGETAGRRCLDLGSDNGVISLLFREAGGAWRSAELDPEAIASIRALVGDPVERLEGPHLPYPDGSFDLVVVVDLLEHLEDDATLARELARVLVPGGRLVANVPHARGRTLLRRLRLALGLTDERHGHVRAGYDAASLRALLEEDF
jgi:SAM-dependent methyltransferase